MQPFPILFRLAVVVAAVLVAVAPGRAAMVRRYRVVVASGDPAPAVGPTVEIGRIFSQPRIGANGHLVFRTRLVGNGGLDRAIWSGRPGAFGVVAMHGAPAPGRSGETLDLDDSWTASSLAVCPDGTVAFLASVLPSGDDGVWMGRGGLLEKVLAVNDDLGGGVQVGEFKEIPFVANGDGRVVIRAVLKGTGVVSRSDSAIWAGKPGDLALVHREGEPAGPRTGGLELGDVGFADLTMNAGGRLAFETLDRAPGLGGDENSVLMTGTREGVQLRLREGDPVPGHPGVVWGNLSLPQLANDGTVTFFSHPNTPDPGRHGIHFPDGTADILATDGAEAAGAPGLSWDIPVFRYPYDTPRPGGAGTAAFVAGLGLEQDYHRDGVWIYRRRELRLVARKFQPAPGDPGGTFLEMGGSLHGQGPSVTEDGVVVFWAETSSRRRGFWRWHAGDLQPLILEDDLVAWRDGTTEAVIAAYAKLGGSGQSGEPSALNDRGQFVFGVFLTGVGDAIMMIDDVMDRDGDGVECLLEQAFGGDPDDPSDGRALLPSWRAADGLFTLAYFARDDGAFDYEVESSADLRDWTTVSQAPSPAGDPAGTPAGTTRMQLRIPIEPGRMHFRVRVARVAGPWQPRAAPLTAPD